jgi:hypothetical protein
LFLAVDLYGTARVTKRVPDRRPGEYVWRLNVELPTLAPPTEVALPVPNVDDAEPLTAEVVAQQLAAEVPT